MGIKPTPQKVYKSSDEELADTIYQREIALTNLREIFKYGNDASTALNYLSTDLTDGSDLSELALFNRHWDDFASQLSKTRNVTPTFFNQAWDRYKLKLANTNNTGIQIPIDSTQFTEHLKQLGNRIKSSIKDRYRLTATQLRDVQTAIEQSIQNRDQERLDRLQQAIEDGNTRVIDKIVSESVSTQFAVREEGAVTRGTLRIESNKLGKLIKEQFDLSKTEIANLNAYLAGAVQDANTSAIDRLYEAMRSDNVVLLRSILDEGRITREQIRGDLETLAEQILTRITNEQELTRVQINTAQDTLEKLIAEQNVETLQEIDRAVHNGRRDILVRLLELKSLSKDQGKKISKLEQRSDYEAHLTTLSMKELRDELERLLGFNPEPQPNGTEDQAQKAQLRQLFGVRHLNKVTREQYVNEIRKVRSQRRAIAEMTSGTGKKKKVKKVIKGKGLRGITPSFEEKFTTFGRYLIHVPSLKNCKLNLKYPSKGYIQPAKEISHQLKDLILYVLENGSVDFTMYESLTPDDKKFFNEICHKASITEGLGLKYSNDDKKEKVKRFNILKGQIEAGNDNKEIRDELKLLILEFIDNGTVNAKVGLEVLRQLDMI